MGKSGVLWMLFVVAVACSPSRDPAVEKYLNEQTENRLKIIWKAKEQEREALLLLAQSVVAQGGYKDLHIKGYQDLLVLLQEFETCKTQIESGSIKSFSELHNGFKVSIEKEYFVKEGINQAGRNSFLSKTELLYHLDQLYYIAIEYFFEKHTAASMHFDRFGFVEVFHGDSLSYFFASIERNVFRSDSVVYTDSSMLELPFFKAPWLKSTYRKDSNALLRIWDKSRVHSIRVENFSKLNFYREKRE